MSQGQALFLVGGRGSRLGDLTAETPKPLLPVAGRPFIEHLLDKAVREGFDDLILLAGYRHEAVQAYEGRWKDASVRVSVEPQPLDTAGAVAQARRLLADEFLVVNGDTWFDFPWSRLTLGEDETARLAAREVAPADRYETLTVDQGRVTDFHPRQPLERGLINGGVYRLRRQAFDDIRERVSLERDVLPKLCAQARLGALITAGDFIDIGLPASLSQANEIASLVRSSSDEA